MEHMDLGVLIVAGLWGVGLIQFIMWIVVMIRHPGLDDFRLDLSESHSNQLKQTCRHKRVGDGYSS